MAQDNLVAWTPRASWWLRLLAALDKAEPRWLIDTRPRGHVVRPDGSRVRCENFAGEQWILS